MTTEREIRRMKINELQVPDEYQRTLDINRSKKIAADFDASKLDLITVSERDGNYYVVDGMHRVSALKILGIRECECVTIRGMTLEEEAKRFYTQNENRRTLKPYDVFKAKLAAKNPAAIEINAIVERNGYKIAKSNKTSDSSTNTIQAIVALEKIYSKYPASVLDEILKFINTIWKDDKITVNQYFLKGTAKFIDLCINQNKYDLKKMKSKLSITTTPAKIMTLAKSRTLSDSIDDEIAIALVEAYNKGRQAGARDKIEKPSRI